MIPSSTWKSVNVNTLSQFRSVCLGNVWYRGLRFFIYFLVCVLLVVLGVGLFHQSAPELAALRRVHEQQLPVFKRQPVVNHHINPLTKLPELRKERESVWERQNREARRQQPPGGRMSVICEVACASTHTPTPTPTFAFWPNQHSYECQLTFQVPSPRGRSLKQETIQSRI